MHEALIGLLEKVELADAATGDLTEPGALDEAARTVAHARLRFDYPEDVLVVALAGGTGSGKSSLFNAMTGTEAAPVGELRPTTARPLAAVPMRHPGAMDGFLDHLGVDHRVEGAHPGMCLIDLPDTDSVEVSHRHRVEAIMPGIDVMVWVVDPEKYRDAALHHRYLQPLAGYASQFVFVLNQVDRLDPESAEEVLADLGAALEEDGIADPVLVAASVAPGGPPSGVEDLARLLESLAEGRSGLYGKLLADIGAVASQLAGMVGRPLGYRELADRVAEEAAGDLGSGDRQGAVAVITGLLEDLIFETRGQVAARLGELLVGLPARVDEEASALSQTGAMRRRAWRQAAMPHSGDRAEGAVAAVARLLRPVEAIMASRARAQAVVADLTLDVYRLRRAARS